MVDVLSTDTEIEAVLAYWFGSEPIDVEPAALDRRIGMWFGGGAAADDDVRRALGPLYARASAGEFDHWAASPRGRLALLVLLDQVPRQLHRGTAAAYACDDRALALADEGVELGLDRALGIAERIFFNMPRGHSEELLTQRRGYAYVTRLFSVAHPRFRERFDAIARKHVEVLERFGRFPQRNAALSRVSTEAEREYLELLKRTGSPF